MVYDLAVALKWRTVELLTVANSEYSKSLRDHFLNVVKRDSNKIFICQASDNE